MRGEQNKLTLRAKENDSAKAAPSEGGGTVVYLRGWILSVTPFF